MADGGQQARSKERSRGYRVALQFGWRRELPMMLQTEAAECGVACLAMVARFHGHDVDLAGLRRRFSTSLKGATLARVMAMAGQLGLTCRPLKLELEELAQLKTPCVLHWDLNHFVVLKRVGKRSVVIHDPARGIRKLSLREVSEHFTGVALELSPAADFAPVVERQAVSLRALTGTVRGLLPALGQILLLALALEVFALVGPFYMQWVLDQVLVSADRDLLTLLGLGFIGVAIFSAIITAARSWAVTWLGATLNVQWASNLFKHLMHLPLDWFEKRHVGDVVSRFGSIQTIQRTLTTQFIGSLLDGVMSLVTLVVMAFYSLGLTALVIGLFAAYGLLRWAFFNPLRRANEEQIVYGARQQSELLESIRGAMPIKLANKQDERLGRYANATVETANRSIGIQRLGIAFTLGNQLMFGIGRVAMIWIAAVLALDGKFSAGMLIAFIAYADQFTSRAAGLIDKWVDFSMLKLHAERVADIALTAPEKAADAAWSGPMPEASIELRHVSFRYAEGEPWILKDCNLRIDAGESVAIVGPSGCGKSTLAKIVLGLLQPTEGEVRFGGIDIRKLGLDTYRQWIGAVMQDDQLFAGSISDNISFFDPDATAVRIEAAARLAAIHDDIAAMPMAYQSLVGDMGSSLSGGQKQRVILARALYRRPKLLVLDEATSHLDVERERQINVVVSRLKMTRVVIAHRTETVASARRIVVLGDGAIQKNSTLERSGVASPKSGRR
ncbi:peptidase domain-containing ABC transporter [Rhodanobacter sp. UC4436_H3]